MIDSAKKKELDILTIFLKQLNVPNNFVSQYEKYNWPNWPKWSKLTMCSNEKQFSIQRDIKNVSLFLYGANLSHKKCYKVNFYLNDIHLLEKYYTIESPYLKSQGG